MIDTVCFIRRYSIKRPPYPKGWVVSQQHFSRTTGKAGYMFWRTVFQHKATGLRACIEGQRGRIEVCLPRMLYPHNGRLVTTQANIDKALSKADRLIAQVTERLPSIPSRKFVRVDLVWQLQGNIEEFIAAHQHAKHPAQIRGKRRAMVHVGETITWAGQQARLTMYDKLREMGKGRHKIVRIELQLSGDKLKAALQNQKAVTQIDLLIAYAFLRSVLLRFSPKPIARVRTKSDVDSWAIKEGWKILGQPAIDRLLERYRSQKRRQEAEQKATRHKLKVLRINWNNLVPPKFPKLFLIDRHGCTYYPPKI